MAASLEMRLFAARDSSGHTSGGALGALTVG
jgi:hypothetical protein